MWKTEMSAIDLFDFNLQAHDSTDFFYATSINHQAYYVKHLVRVVLMSIIVNFIKACDQSSNNLVLNFHKNIYCHSDQCWVHNNVFHQRHFLSGIILCILRCFQIRWIPSEISIHGSIVNQSRKLPNTNMNWADIVLISKYLIKWVDES